MPAAQYLMKSKIGPIYLVASDQALLGVHWKKQTGIPLLSKLNSTQPEVKLLNQAVKQLEEYFQGKRQSFDLPLAAEGTPFQKQV